MIVFTDLDGTLLDRNSQSYAAAEPALRMLGARDVPLVLVTAGTAAEVAPLMAQMGLATPAIVEDGAGIFDGTPSDVSLDYVRIRAAIDRLPRELRAAFEGFGDMDEARLMKATGATAEQARAKARRRFSETGLFTGSPAQREAFVGELESVGLTARMKGPLLTVSKGRTKSLRLAEIRELMERRLHRRLFPTVAVGDAETDRDLLDAADIAVVVANPDAPPLPPLRGEHQGRVIRTDLAGPQGWNGAIQLLVDVFAHHFDKRASS